MKQFAQCLSLCLGLCAILLGPANAQQLEASAGDQALRVFLDCRSRHCDFDHFRREITFVNYVRDRKDAHVHILVTTRSTGSGTEFNFDFIGQQEFSGIDDSIQHYSSRTDTDNEIRDSLTRNLKLGLVRYVARTPVAPHLEVSYLAPDTLQNTPQKTYDPWDFWIFRARLGGNLNGEQLQRFFSGNGSVSANRTTEAMKISLSVNGWYSQDEFDLNDSTTFTSVSRVYGGETFVVWSLGEHWGAAALVEGRTSTFQNYDLNFKAGSGIEFSLFPYSESTRRALTFVYTPLLRIFDYKKETIFEKTSETRAAHLFEINYSVKQPWGFINTSLDMSSFIPEFDQHRIDLSVGLNIRLVRGLQLNLRSFVSRTKDQIYLPRDSATEEEILVRRHELGTDYRYFTSLSLSYTFGSIFNNIVNPRFD